MAARVSVYTWRGIDRNNRSVAGEVEARTMQEARLQLRRQQIRIRTIRKQTVSAFSSGSRVSNDDIVFFTRQLATMIEAGVPITQALHGIIRGSEKPGMRKLLRKITDSVEAGNTLSTTLKQYPKHFDTLYTSLVNIGEHSGMMGLLLEKVAMHLEKIQHIKGKVRSAMMYPIITLAITFGLVSVLLVAVIPEFAVMFNSFGAELPWMTRKVVQASEILQEYWYLVLGGIVGGVGFLMYSYPRSLPLRRNIDRIMLRLPIFGKIFRNAIISRFTRNLSIMFGAGMTLVDSLEAVAHVAGNQIYLEGILDIRREVTGGRPVSHACADTKLFPGMVVQMISVGEESGELQRMLESIADFYDSEVDNAVATLSSLIEPLLIVIIGVMVGGIIVAMYLPIFKLGTVL